MILIVEHVDHIKKSVGARFMFNFHIDETPPQAELEVRC